MTLQQLRYVITVAQKGTISEAAKELFISQPSLTNAIRELEKEMNIKEKEICSKEEVLMYAAAMLYAKNEEFPYDIKLSEEIVRTEIADITNAIIAKK